MSSTVRHFGSIILTGESARFTNEAKQLNQCYDVYAFRVGRPEESKVAVLFKDITEYKQLESELRQKEERLRIAKAAAKIGIYDYDKATRQIFSAQTQSHTIEAPVQGVTRVVFADDHHIMRQGLVNLVNACQYIEVVGEAANGQEALELALHLFYATLGDISMPVMDGIEATRRIKAELPDVRVIGLFT